MQRKHRHRSVVDPDLFTIQCIKAKQLPIHSMDDDYTSAYFGHRKYFTADSCTPTLFAVCRIQRNNFSITGANQHQALPHPGPSGNFQLSIDFPHFAACPGVYCRDFTAAGDQIEVRQIDRRHQIDARLVGSAAD